MFYFQLPMAEAAVALNNFAFIEQLWRDWSPSWDVPMEELESVKATLAKPGVLTAALSYYRHSLNPPSDVPSSDGITPRIQIPTLYIHGREDGCIGVELTDDVAQFFDNEFRKVVIDGAGHFVHQEKPELVNRVILEFLRQ
jgi:pimeloyl-ACP methyl ester carboxylesterase